MNFGENIKYLVMIVVLVIAFGAFVPVVQSAISDANITNSGAETLADNIILFLALGIVLAIISFAVVKFWKGGE